MSYHAAFNTIKLKLPKYQQVVTKPTRGNKVLDKCVVNIKNAYNYCQPLATLGNSDHHVIHVMPKYRPQSAYKPKVITKRNYSHENCESLMGCFEAADWGLLIHPGEDINSQVDVLTSYINFCTDLCIPVMTKKVHQNNKPWIHDEIIQLVQQKHKASANGDIKLTHHLEHKIKQRTH